MTIKSHIFFYLLFIYGFSLYGQSIDTVKIGQKNKLYKVNYTQGSTYFWNVGGGGGIINPPSISNEVYIDWGYRPGLYPISVIEQTSNGCWGDSIFAYVYVQSDFILELDAPAEVCYGEKVKLTAKGADNYLWSTGETIPSIIVSPTLFNQNFYVIGYYQNYPPDTAHTDIVVNFPPKAAFSFDPENPKINQTINFAYTGTPVLNYKWWVKDIDPRTGNSKTLALTNSPFTDHSFNSGGNKELMLIVTDNNGCSDTANFTIFVNDEVVIFVPNAFSPNGDGINDVFYPVSEEIKEIQFEIFNRWGTLIFSSNKPGHGWDGKYKGEYVAAGEYYYSIYITGINNKNYPLKGTVTLIR
jgi:gliding motility-associated-like protein